MNSQSHEQLTDSSVLPPEQQEVMPGVPEHFGVPGPETAANIAVEQGTSTVPSQPPVSDTSPASSPVDPQASSASSATQQDPASTAGMPMIADDTDLIEKEWVDKAKQIVARTSHDPYLQNKEINKMKADYLKKRYNKDLKLVDE